MMAAFKLKGVYTALVTPFTPDGTEINFETLLSLIQRQIDANVSGIVLFGTTGESATLTFQERTVILKRVVEYAKGKIQIMAGCGTCSTQTTLEQVRQAEELGADALQLLSPYYNKPTQEGLYTHFKAVNDSTRLPICLYNIPGRTAVNIEPRTFVRLAKLDRIIGTKEASGSIQQIMDVLEETAMIPKFTVLAGDDLLFLPLAAVGAQGVTSVVSNLLPAATNQLVQLALKGHYQQAKNMFFKMKPLIQSLFIETNPAPIKYLLSAKGYQVGPCRMPLAPLSESTRNILNNLVRTASTFEIEPALELV